MLHKHKWEIIETIKFENELQKFSGTGIRMDGFTANDLARRGVITVCSCEKCNKVKHIKTIL